MLVWSITYGMGTGGVAEVGVCVDCWFLNTRLKNCMELLRAGCPSLSLAMGIAEVFTPAGVSLVRFCQRKQFFFR